MALLSEEYKVPYRIESRTGPAIPTADGDGEKPIPTGFANRGRTTAQPDARGALPDQPDFVLS